MASTKSNKSKKQIKFGQHRRGDSCPKPINKKAKSPVVIITLEGEDLLLYWAVERKRKLVNREIDCRAVCGSLW
jgi:hypothetical protein